MDATATGADEIGIGFSKTSGAAAALGVEFEKVASWIAVISSRTRESAQSIGHSINTMLSRLSRITTTGFNEEDDTKINDVAKALNSVDIALTDTDGNFRDFGTILDEINGKWSSLDDQTKSYIANTMAGTRQQSRFFNLMEGYAESIDLYEEALESAGTAQSKFNLYLESNQATLDTFRTTIEGLWTTIIDSDSLMNVVRAGTEFVEILDGMVQNLGLLGTTANFLIPLMGIKLVGSFRSTYIEMMKLYAANNMTLLPSPASIGATVKSMLGFTTTVKGATVATSGLTVATAGLTLGIGLLAAGVMWWANESKKAKQAFADALDNSQQLNEELNSLDSLIKKQEDLIKIENKSVDQKEELIKVQKELAQLYPELATGIDEEGNKIADNIELTKELAEEKRKLLEQELLIIKTTADQKLPQLKKELADMQDEADQVQKRLLSGDVYETVNYEGYDIQINKTEDLKKRLLELVSSQKEHYEEITKLESGVKSYNEILKENEERLKWATAAELERQSASIKSEGQYVRIREELKRLGFTSDEISKIMSGNLKEVKDSYNVLTDAQIENYKTIDKLNDADKKAATEMLNRSKTLTESIIQNTKARILAIRAEIESLIGRDSAGNTYLDRTYGMHPAKQAISDELKRQEEELAKETHENLKRLAEIDKALANIGGLSASGSISGTRDSKSSSSSSKDSRQFLDSIDAEIRAIKIKNDNLIKTRDLLQEELAIAKDTEGAEGLNKQYEVTGRIIEHNNKILQSFKEEQGLIHARANDIRDTYSQYDIDSWFDANGEATLTYINQFNKASKEQQEEMSKVFGWIQAYKKGWTEANDEIKKVLESNKELGKELEKILEQHKEIARVAWIEEQNKLYDEQQKRLNALEDIQEKIVAIIRKRGEEERKALDEAYKAEMDSLEERHKGRKEGYQKDLDEFRKYIQGRLDILDDQWESEDYQENLNKEREEANRIQREIDILSLDDSLTARNKTIELRKQLADQNEKIAKMQQKKERDELKKSLQDQLKNKEESVKETEKIADKLYENDKKRLEEDYRINKEFLERKYSEEKIYAEARESIMRGTVEVTRGSFVDMYDAFVTFEDKFGKGMGILGDIIKDDFIVQLDNAKRAIEELDYLSSSRLTKYDSNYQPTNTQMNYTPPKTIQDYSDAYFKAREDGDWKAMEYANRQANILRGLGDIVTSTEDIEMIKKKYGGSFKHGGEVLSSGLMLTEFHGRKDDPEWIFNSPQLEKVLKSAVLSTVNVVAPKIPNISQSQGVVYHIDKIFDISGTVTEDIIPSIRKEASGIEETLKNLNKGGVFRPVKI